MLVDIYAWSYIMLTVHELGDLARLANPTGTRPKRIIHRVPRAAHALLCACMAIDYHKHDSMINVDRLSL